MKVQKDNLYLTIYTAVLGRGLDICDIRFVFHASLPLSLGDYIQESGRAGRDGSTAYAVLFYRAQDHTSVQRIKNSNKNDASIEATSSSDEEMMQYCTQGQRCRYSVLASHVMMPLSCASQMQTCGKHARCDICEKPSYEEVDITNLVKAFLQKFESKTSPPHQMLRRPDVDLLLKSVFWMAITAAPKYSEKKQLCLLLVGKNETSLCDDLLRLLTWLNVLKACNKFDRYEKGTSLKSILAQLRKKDVFFVLKIALDTKKSFKSLAVLENSANQKESLSKVYGVEETDNLDGRPGSSAQRDDVMSILGIPDSCRFWLDRLSTLPFLLQFEILR